MPEKAHLKRQELQRLKERKLLPDVYSAILKILEKYGLIRINKKTEGIEIHRLIHTDIHIYMYINS